MTASNSAQPLAPSEQRPAAWRLRAQGFVRQFGVLLAFVVLCAVFAALDPRFLSQRNLSNIAIQSSTNAVVALGMTFVIASAGIDLSVGSVLALTGIIMASLLHSGVPVPLTIILGLGSGALCGVSMGLLITKGRLPPFIVTLGGLSIFRGLALLYTDGRPVIGVPQLFRSIGAGSVLGIPTPWIIVVVAGLATYFVIHRTKLGEATIAIGGNEEAARLSGINVDLTKITIYGICSMMAAMGAVIVTARLGTAEPIAGQGYELDAIAAVVMGGSSLFGGQARVFGTVIGALIIAALRNGLTLLNIPSFSQQVAVGVVVILAVFVDQLGRRRA